MPKGYSLLRASLGNSRDKANPLGFVRWRLFIFGVSLSCWQTILFQGLTASIQRWRECALLYVGFVAERERLASWCCSGTEFERNHAELATAETTTRQGGASAFLLNVRFPRKQLHWELWSPRGPEAGPSFPCSWQGTCETQPVWRENVQGVWRERSGTLGAVLRFYSLVFRSISTNICSTNNGFLWQKVNFKCGVWVFELMARSLIFFSLRWVWSTEKIGIIFNFSFLSQGLMLLGLYLGLFLCPNKSGLTTHLP